MAYDFSDGSNFDQRKKVNPLARFPDSRAPGAGGNDLRAEDPAQQAQNMRRVQDAVFGPKTPQDAYAQGTTNYRPGQNLATPPPAPVQTLPRPQEQQPTAPSIASPPPAAGFQQGQAPIFRRDNSFSDNPNGGGTQVTAPGRGTLTTVGDQFFTTPSSGSATKQSPRPQLASYVGLDGKEHEDTRTGNETPYNGGSGQSFGDSVIARGKAEAQYNDLTRAMNDAARGGFGRTAAEFASSAASLRNAATGEREAGTKSRLADFETGAKGEAEIGNLNASARRSLAEADPNLLAARVGQVGAESGELRSRSALTDAQRDVATTELGRQRKLSEALDDYQKNPTPAKRDALLLMQGKDKPEQYAFPVEKDFNDLGQVTGEHIVPFNKFTGQRSGGQPQAPVAKNAAGAQMQTKDGRVLTVQKDGTYLEAKTGKKYDANGKPAS